MADPLGPSILTVFFLLIASFVYALNAILPSIAESELLKNPEPDASSRRILRLLDRFDHGYGEIRMTYVLLLSGAYLTLFFWLDPLLAQLLPTVPVLRALLLLAAFCTIAFALTITVAGSLAANAPEKALSIVAAPTEWAILALSPLCRCAYWIGRAILLPFRIRPTRISENVTEEEILMMVDIGEEKGAIEADEKEMIENIFEFNNMTAEDCMIHRKDITAIDVDSTDDEILETITDSGLSRFPVYEDSIDNVVGLLTARDFFINRCSDTPKPFRELIRPAHFVPESVRTDVLFREMQIRKQHMAIIIDEYGGTSGLITLEDLLEEIVGNIYDEYDSQEEQEITPLPDGRWRVSGSAELEVLNERLEIELPLEEEFDTLGGLVFSQLAQIPADGAKPVVECFGLRISVTEIADRRVEWAIVEKFPDPEPSDHD